MGATQQIVAVDIGGTNARFALASVADGRVVSIGVAVTFETAAYDGIEDAWEAFRSRTAGSLPRAAAIAIAAPVRGDIIRLTNQSRWVIRPADLGAAVGVDALLLVNDFEAVGHAATNVAGTDLDWICGPHEPLPDCGVVSVIGPGTGLGVAWVLRTGRGDHVQATEGGHIEFAPVGEIEAIVDASLRRQHGRVSAERAICGQSIAEFYAAIAMSRGLSVVTPDDRSIWKQIAEGNDELSMAAAEYFCQALGSVAGDIALAQGASAVVIAGGVGQRLQHILPKSGFAGRFCAKGRYRDFMAAIPVKLITLDQPGLFGAAAAFARRDANA